MRIARPSRLLGAGATITSSGAVDGQYPLTSLHTGTPTEPCRWTTNAETRIVWDFGSATTIEGLLVVMHTLAAAAVVKVQAHTADSWGSPAVSVDVTVPAWPDHLPPNLLADLRATALATTGYRFVSLLLPASSANHAIGEVCWVAQWDAPQSSCAWPVRRGDVRRVSVNSTAFGVDHVIERRVRQRRLWPMFAAITDADRALWLGLAREAGASRGWVLVLDTHETDDFHASAEGLFVRFAPEAANQLQEELIVFGATAIALDVLEVQRGLPL